MADRLRIAAPLEVDGWEIIEALEEHALFDEFAERIDTAIGLLHEGQALWREHLKDGEWSSEAGHTVAEVRRLAYNIRQRIERDSSDLAPCIRWAVGASSTVTDSQCVAALAMDRACWALETLARWLADFDSDLHGVSSPDVRALLEESPTAFAGLVETLRGDCAQSEMETRERVADLLGTSRHYMTIAEMYASPVLSTTEKARISAAASRAGRCSATARQQATEERNARICAAAHRMLANGVSARDIVGKIAGSAAAEKEPGGMKLTTKQIRNILRAHRLPL